MAWILYHTKERGRPHILRWYQTHKGAMIGMRASNKNAGYKIRYEVKRLEDGAVVETALNQNSYAILRAPYAIIDKESYKKKYAFDGI